jgi:ABC-2 type transport system ATP-binding protein
MMNNGAIEVTDLHVVRGGVKAVDGVTFTVASGEVTGLLGPSGCGKTSLMRSIVGVQIVKAGKVMVDGTPAGAAPLRHRIGYVTQSPSVYDDLTVEENLRFFARVLGLDGAEVDRCIAAVELDDNRDRLASLLSGGQRSRVSLAVALLGSPDFLVLDEPTVGLDPVLRRDLWNLFHRLADAGAAVLVSSHVMDEAERCDRLLLMRNGRILADDTPDGLLEHTGEPSVEHAFLFLVDSARQGELR